MGSWDALSEIMGTTSNKKIEIQSQNNFIHASSTNADKKYVFIDTDELIVVDTEDAMLISKKGSTQSVKEAVDQLKAVSPQFTKDHTYEFCPWGQYQILRNESHCPISPKCTTQFHTFVPAERKRRDFILSTRLQSIFFPLGSNFCNFSL